ncbi:hypothetical protein KQX54_016973, partial [Cotesia glomerata]
MAVKRFIHQTSQFPLGLLVNAREPGQKQIRDAPPPLYETRAIPALSIHRIIINNIWADEHFLYRNRLYEYELEMTFINIDPVVADFQIIQLLRQLFRVNTTFKSFNIDDQCVDVLKAQKYPRWCRMRDAGSAGQAGIIYTTVNQDISISRQFRHHLRLYSLTPPKSYRDRGREFHGYASMCRVNS